MRLKIGDTLYLQNWDYFFIIGAWYTEEYPIQLFIDGKSSLDPKNQYVFERAYKSPEAIEWIEKQDWIVDFDEYVVKTIEDLEDIIEDLHKEHQTENADFDAKSDDYRKDHFEEQIAKLIKLNHKMATIGWLVDYKKGLTDNIFPEGYQPPSNN